MRAGRFAAVALAVGLAVAGCSKGSSQPPQGGVDAPERVTRGEEFTLRAFDGWVIAGSVVQAEHDDGSLKLLYGQRPGSGKPSARLGEADEMIHDDVADALVQELRYVFPETAKAGVWQLCTSIVNDAAGQSEMESEKVCVQIIVR